MSRASTYQHWWGLKEAFYARFGHEMGWLLLHEARARRKRTYDGYFLRRLCHVYRNFCDVCATGISATTERDAALHNKFGKYGTEAAFMAIAGSQSFWPGAQPAITVSGRETSCVHCFSIISTSPCCMPFLPFSSVISVNSVAIKTGGASRRHSPHEKAVLEEPSNEIHQPTT